RDGRFRTVEGAALPRRPSHESGTPAGIHRYHRRSARSPLKNGPFTERPQRTLAAQLEGELSYIGNVAGSGHLAGDERKSYIQPPVPRVFENRTCHKAQRSQPPRWLNDDLTGTRRPGRTRNRPA